MATATLEREEFPKTEKEIPQHSHRMFYGHPQGMWMDWLPTQDDERLLPVRTNGCILKRLKAFF